MKRNGQCGRKESWNVKWYGTYGKKISWVVKWFGKTEERKVEQWYDKENMEER